jgi:hypothetical protein
LYFHGKHLRLAYTISQAMAEATEPSNRESLARLLARPARSTDLATSPKSVYAVGGLAFSGTCGNSGEYRVRQDTDG